MSNTHNEIGFINADGTITTYGSMGGGGGGDTPTIVQKPTVVVGTYTYDGTAQGPTITWATGAESNCIVTNATKTEAGTHTLTIALKNIHTMVWNDSTTADLTYEYTIAKADQTITLSSDTVILDPEHLTSTVTVSGVQGAISVTSSASSVATASVSGSTITISSVNDTTGSATITVSVAGTTNYNPATDSTISVSADFADFLTDWLTAANLNPASYVDLDAVLADESAVKRLFTIHDAVDTLVREVGSIESTDLTKIFNDNYVAKWVNLRDYALDTLYANSTIADYMDTADKYFYGEWALMPQVPTMTSNTAPYGVASASTEGTDGGSSNGKAFNAFDGNDSTFWFTSTGYDTGWLQYQFVTSTNITRIEFKQRSDSAHVKNFKVQGSNDGSTWTDIYTGLAPNEDAVSFDFTNANNYLYYRFLIIDNHYEGNRPLILTFQFYTWGAKGNVPVMTSNTTPYGVASSSTDSSDYWYAWQAFREVTIGDKSTGWGTSTLGTASASQYVRYQFVSPTMAIKMSAEWIFSQAGNVTYIVQASNDGSTWTDLTSNITVTSRTTDSKQSINLENSTAYLYYQVKIVSVSGGNDRVYIGALQFYGREMKVFVPTMTSNTSPYGEVSASSVCSQSVTAYAPYKAFDKNNSTTWYSDQQSSCTDQWLEYDFKKSVCIKSANITYMDSQYMSGSFKFQASNDGTNWVDITDDITSFSTTRFDFQNNNGYRKYRYYINSETVNSVGFYCGRVTELQFFGFDYSERVWDDLIIGNTYFFGGHYWTAAEDLGDGAVCMQSQGMTAGTWPAYKLTTDYTGTKNYGSANTTYNGDIDGDNIANYDDVTSTWYQKYSAVEKTGASYGSGLFLVSNAKCGTTTAGSQGSGNYWSALKTASINNGPTSFLGTVNTSGGGSFAWNVASTGAVQSAGDQATAYNVAPAFNLDLAKVKLVDGDHIMLPTEEMPTLVTWANGTEAQIKAELDAYYDGIISWTDMGWNVGDTRLMHFNSMQAPNPNSSNTWAAQDITAVIVDHDHNDLATPINGHTKACITVQTREVMNNITTSTPSAAPLGIYANGDADKDYVFTKWANLYLRIYINSTVLDAIPTGDFKSAIKQSKHYRHTAYNTADDELVTDTLFIPSAPEVVGSNVYRYYTATTHTEGSQFAYYATAANGIKYGNNNGSSNGVAQYYWLGSPSSYYDTGNQYCWMMLYANGNNSDSNGTGSPALAPAWCM